MNYIEWNGINLFGLIDIGFIESLLTESYSLLQGQSQIVYIHNHISQMKKMFFKELGKVYPDKVFE